jgi:hypothetical protein
MVSTVTREGIVLEEIIFALSEDLRSGPFLLSPRT